jgi:hypothetical protein
MAGRQASAGAWTDTESVYTIGFIHSPSVRKEIPGRRPWRAACHPERVPFNICTFYLPSYYMYLGSTASHPSKIDRVRDNASHLIWPQAVYYLHHATASRVKRHDAACGKPLVTQRCTVPNAESSQKSPGAAIEVH